MAIRSTHKGDRAQLGPRVDRVVYDAVAAHSGQYGDGIPMSQWVADLLAAIVGHPELMRELDGEDVAQIFARALDNPDLLRGRG
ncbi:MAG: toxin-antitoxin system [Actinomycetota bacterium]